MDPNLSAFRLLARRTSCPTAATELKAIQKRQGEQGQTRRTAKSAPELSSLSRTSELLQRPKMSRKCLFDGGDTLVCLRQQLQHIHIPKSVDYNNPFYTSKSTTSVYEEIVNGHGLEDGLSLHREKNEAEIIEEFPINQRRLSLPTVFSSGRFMPGNVVSTAAFITVHDQGQAKRRYGSLANSFDRELLCLRRNNKEEERLQQTFRRLDKQSLVDNADFRRRIQKMFNEYHKLVQVSPTVDEWLATRPQISTYRRRERSHTTDS